MKNHRLYEVNLGRKTAFCVVCGYTEIHMRPIRTRHRWIQGKLKVYEEQSWEYNHLTLHA